MGAAFLWGKKPRQNKTFQLVNFFFSSFKFSSECLLSLPPWSVSVQQNVFPVSEMIRGCLSSTANGRFLNCRDQEGGKLGSRAGD